MFLLLVPSFLDAPARVFRLFIWLIGLVELVELVGLVGHGVLQVIVIL